MTLQPQTRLNSSAKSIWAPGLLPIMASTLTAISLAAFDGLGISVAGNKIGGALGHINLLPYIFSAFTLTLTVSSLAAGALIDGWGLRRVYRATLIGYFFGSLGCTIAPTMQWLIVARLSQGIGGGMIFAVSLAAVGISVPEHLRSRAFAANSMVWGVMSFAGPAIADLLLKSPLGWRSVFFVNLPLTIFAAVIGWSRLPGRNPEASVRFDTRGLLLVGITSSVLLVAVSNGSRYLIVLLAGAAAFGFVTWRHLRGVDDPLLDLRFLTKLPIGGINIALLMLFAGGVSVETFVPLFVKGALRGSDTKAAFSVTFMAFGWAVASVVASRVLDSVRETTVLISGALLAAIPIVIGALMYSASTPIALVAVLSLAQGCGLGAASNSGLTLLQRTAKPDEMGRASATHHFVRNLGTVVGVSASGGVLLAVAKSRLGSLDAIRPLLRGDSVKITDLKVPQAVAAGYRTANTLAAICALIGLFFAFRVQRFLRNTYKVNPSR